MSTHLLLSLIRQADSLDRAGEFERSDAVLRTVESMLHRPSRFAANPVTDWSDFAHNTDVAFRNWRDSGGGMGFGMLQGQADPQALLDSMRESLNRLRGRLTNPATRIPVESRGLCTRILDMAIQTLSAYDPEKARAQAEQRIQQLPQMTLNPSASTATANVRLANDDSRIVGDIADARGAIAYLADESIFAGGRAVHSQITRGLDTMSSIISGATTSQQAVSRLSPQPGQAMPVVPQSTPQAPVAAAYNAQNPATPRLPVAPEITPGESTYQTYQTTSPAAWSKSVGGYDREAHIDRYLQYAAQQRLDSSALAARLHQYEGDMSFITEVMQRFNQRRREMNRGRQEQG